MDASDTPDNQLEAFIVKFDPEIAQLARDALASLRDRLPGAYELVYDNYNALAIGFGLTEWTSDAVVSLAVYPRGVNLYFLHGAHLPDPERRLRGSGKQGRFVPIFDAKDLKEPAIQSLLAAACSASAAPFPAGSGGGTLIKSISARQRPRKPGQKA